MKYQNNNFFRFSFICGIYIITHVIFMKIRIVHTLKSDWLYGVRIKTSSVSSMDLYDL